jgi:hypothetical protein
MNRKINNGPGYATSLGFKLHRNSVSDSAKEWLNQNKYYLGALAIGLLGFQFAPEMYCLNGPLAIGGGSLAVINTLVNLGK